MFNRRFWIYALVSVVLVASVVLLGLSLYRLNQNNQTIATLRSANSTLQTRLNDQDPAAAEQLKTELENTRNAYAALEDQFNQANETVNRLNTQVTDLQESEAKLTALRQQLEESSSREATLSGQVDELTAQIALQEMELEGLRTTEETSAEAAAQVQDLSGQVSELQKKLEESQAAFTELDGQYTELSQDFAAYQLQAQQTEDALTAAQAELEGMNAQAARDQETITRLTGENAQAGSEQLAAVQAELDQAKAELDHTKAELAELNGKYEASQTNLTDALSSVITLKEKGTAKDQALTEAATRQQQTEQELETVRAALTEAQEALNARAQLEADQEETLAQLNEARQAAGEKDQTIADLNLKIAALEEEAALSRSASAASEEMQSDFQQKTASLEQALEEAKAQAETLNAEPGPGPG